ncbi:NUDIX domain-containing protein [Aliirhizobium smilacinae]|uniref:NUDIX domain-containing protein n=1 Tax=Aliirhizobium smilacinae TaxID=1395944 RepID=A0A5C4XHJ9_9HYPH|nr:NUDIX domain-containing protein [Rhizobium smilacinae]TNM62966.1 NUDIX domain-containing protein [Rhizobium smilacinae]
MSATGIAEIGTWRTRALVWLLHRFFLLSRGMTMGVRAACFNDRGEVFLVRHTYVPGWYMPGGGMEHGETALEALAKELREEGNLVMTAAPEFVNVYYNSKTSKRDHVLFYRVTVEQTAPRLPDREIAESGFFALDALPDEVTDATLRRLQELSKEVELSDFW